MSGETNPDSILDLPHDVLAHITTLLQADPVSLAMCSCTCRMWRKCANDDQVAASVTVVGAKLWERYTESQTHSVEQHSSDQQAWPMSHCRYGVG